MKYGWVLLLELVCIASPLRADATGTMFGLLPARNHKHPFPFFRVWTVRKECGRCSPQVSSRKSQSVAGTAALWTRATMSNTQVSVVASERTSEQTWQSTEQVEPGKNIEQEILFSSSYSQFKDTELALDLFSLYEILSLLFKSRKSYQL